MDGPTSRDIKQQARNLGFDLCGIAPAGDHPELTFFQTWLARGYAGEMAYLARSADARADVRRVLPSAQSVIVTGTLYNTNVPYSTESAAPGVLDSTRCISYLTIEQRGAIPAELTRAVGSHVYGCDVCQEVYPWNQIAPCSSDPAWQPRPAWRDASVSALASMSDGELRNAMRGSAMTRTKVSGMRRNLAAALTNSQGRGVS